MMTTATQRYAFTVDDYYRMAEAGILSKEERFELIEGDIITMSPIGSAHAAYVSHLTRLLVLKAGETAIVSIQNPVVINDYSEPEPDIMLLRPRDDFYEANHPTPSDVLLLIEVSESTLRFDRQTKLPLYARAGIPEAWIVNLIDRVVEIYRKPGEDGYLDARQPERNEQIAPELLPSIILTPADVLR